MGRFALAGRAGHDHDRRLLGERGGDGIHHVERARAVGHDGNAQTRMRAGGGIGREPDRGLVAQGIERQDARFLDHLEECEREIARDPEDLGRAVVLERRQEGERDARRPGLPQAQLNPLTGMHAP
jgi:hypothetical protein